MGNQLIEKLESLCDTKAEMAQLVLHEVLHAIWSEEASNGLVSRDQLTQAINTRFKLSTRAQEL